MRDLTDQESLGVGRRRDSPERRSRGGGSPEQAKIGVPGLDLARDLV